jgi:hypothetical protein
MAQFSKTQSELKVNKKPKITINYGKMCVRERDKNVYSFYLIRL